MKFIALQAFNSAIEAHLAKNLLEQEGIKVVIRDEHLNTLNPLYTQALGGVRLEVQESDYEVATQILRHSTSQPYTNEQGEVLTCPKCGSEHILSGFTSTRSIKSIFANLIAFLTLTLPIYTKKVYRCKDCGREFEDSGKP